MIPDTLKSMKTLDRLAERLHALESVDKHPYQRQLRVLQSMWREQQGYAVALETTWDIEQVLRENDRRRRMKVALGEAFDSVPSQRKHSGSILHTSSLCRPVWKPHLTTQSPVVTSSMVHSTVRPWFLLKVVTSGANPNGVPYNGIGKENACREPKTTRACAGGQ